MSTEKTTSKAGADVDQSNVAAVLRMEMGRIVIVKEHLDDDA